jgi:hypothetical protein
MTADEAAGLQWWNRMTESQRGTILQFFKANTSAEAWDACKREYAAGTNLPMWAWPPRSSGSEPKVIRCPVCNKENGDWAHICGHCGAALVPSSGASITNAGPTGASTTTHFACLDNVFDKTIRVDRRPQQPTADELAGMQWWNSMTEAERAQALAAAGWRSGGTHTPSAADAWAHHKRDDQARIAWWDGLSKAEREKALDRAGDGGHIPSAADAWREHKRRMGLEESSNA